MLVTTPVLQGTTSRGEKGTIFHVSFKEEEKPFLDIPSNLFHHVLLAETGHGSTP